MQISMERETEFYLNWNEHVLVAWQDKYDELLVSAISEGVRLGHDFPAVDVVRREGKWDRIKGIYIYEIAFGYNESIDLRHYGGLHRSLAHKLNGVSLKCNLLEKHREDSHYKRFVPLKNVSPIGIKLYHDDRGVRVDRIVETLRHLPRNIVEEFCGKNDLDTGEYLSQ